MIPYSSGMRWTPVEMRQVAFSSLPSNRPMVILVLPMSMASSTLLPSTGSRVFQLFNGLRQHGQQVRGEHTGLAEAVPDHLAGGPVQGHPESGGLEKRQTQGGKHGGASAPD